MFFNSSANSLIYIARNEVPKQSPFSILHCCHCEAQRAEAIPKFRYLAISLFDIIWSLMK